ncbi:MAG: PEP/pyruvate-binding domain-containing protein [Anaerolineaceae bacterium]
MNSDILFFDEINNEQRVLAGGKGGSLSILFQAGFPVPPGFVIFPTSFNGNGLKPDMWVNVQKHINKMRDSDPGISFAIRSSALCEDSEKTSFAGEFETILNVKTDEEIHQAILSVYNSRKNERVQAYSQVKGIDQTDEIAIVVQKLVHADCSGVLFTANPVNGRRDQAVLTSTWGLGEAIVGGMVTPDMQIVDKHTFQLISQEIADKRVMTVELQKGTVEQQVPEKKRKALVLSGNQVTEIIKLGIMIEEYFGRPMDIEWAAFRNKMMLVQARPITALPDPLPPAPTEWKLPKGQYAAMRNNIIELMPNPLTPLFETLGCNVINKSLSKLLTQFLGMPGIMPNEIILTVNGYAYNNGSVKPLKAFWMIFGMVGILKRMFRGAVERWTETGYPSYVTAIKRLESIQWRDSSATIIVDSIHELYGSAIDAYGALISGVIPAAWMSEALFTKYYNLFVRRRGDPAAQTFLLGFDNIPIRAEKNLFAIADWVRNHHGLAAFLTDTPTTVIVEWMKNMQIPPEVDAEDWQIWQSHFGAYLKQFGHTIYDLDFSNPVPADDPAPLLDTCRMFLVGDGVNPTTRQSGAVERREQAQQSVEKRLKGLKLKNFKRFLNTAQKFAPLREDGLADIGLGYPLLRQMLLELGQRLTAGGMIERPDDVFWMTETELSLAATKLDNAEPLLPFGNIIPQRKATWRAAKLVTPPMMLPQMKFLGIDLSELKSHRTRKLNSYIIKGVAASPGKITAQACILHNTEDFPKMRTGDVLVAAITTPAWTPLFARASAVITDVGGPLSHGSIVAREYGIPAVLGTGVATLRIRNGQKVTVDGDKGIVLLQKED